MVGISVGVVVLVGVAVVATRAYTRRQQQAAMAAELRLAHVAPVRASAHDIPIVMSDLVRLPNEVVVDNYLLIIRYIHRNTMNSRSTHSLQFSIIYFPPPPQLFPLLIFII